jgi:hypothetical protein
MKYRVKVLKITETWVDVTAVNELDAQGQAKMRPDAIAVLGVMEAPDVNPLIDNTPPELSCA